MHHSRLLRGGWGSSPWMAAALCLVTSGGCGGSPRPETEAHPGGVSLLMADGEPPVLGSADAPPGYSLVWGDEFENSTVDSSKWNTFENSNYGSSNKEDQCYFARNVSVGGGTLKITARRETVTCGATNPDTGTRTYYFTSGFLTTRNQGGPLKFKFRYGYTEARIKMPKGNPYWGAFWLVGPGDGSTPGTWPAYGEFDVTELLGARPDLTHGTFHYACTGRASCNTSSAAMYNVRTGDSYQGSSNFGPQLTPSNFVDGETSTRFVRYGFLWQPDRITWYVDGKPMRYLDADGNLYRYRPDGSKVFDRSLTSVFPNNPPTSPLSTVFAYEHSIHLNLAFGGGFPRYSTYGYTGIETATGYSDGNLAATLPAAMEVDYVRVFRLPGQ
ncbi:glycoside hydrolase family 16 protein [Cystobacter fuscus]|nr:glycoside hydrolase family 16 protein [Cystobacter fuscus]